MMRKNVCLVLLVVVIYVLVFPLSTTSAEFSELESAQTICGEPTVSAGLISVSGSKRNDSACNAIVTFRGMDEEQMPRMKQRVGVREEGKNYNQIIDGHGTGLAPPTEEEWAEIESTVCRVDTVLFAETSQSPSSVDHTTSPWFPPIGNQDGEGSCVTWALGYYTKTFQEAKEHGWNVSRARWEGGYNGHPTYSYQDKIFSPDFIYHLINGGVDEGSNYYQAITLICSIGVSSWKSMPYNPHDSTTWPSEKAWREAAYYRGASTGPEIMETDTDDGILSLKNWIASENLAVISVDANQYSKMTGADFWTLDNYVEPKTNHANTIVGYDDNIKYKENGQTCYGAFKIANSWGIGGWEHIDDGCYWISYEAMKQRVVGCNIYSDRTGYKPELMASFRISHSKRGQCGISVGMGSHSNPDAQKSFSVNAFPVNGGTRSFCSNNIVFDITEFKQSVPTVYNRTFFISLWDSRDGTTGTITNFQINNDVSSGPPMATVDDRYVFADVVLHAYTLHLESRQDNGASYNVGILTFDGTAHSLPQDITVEVGNYSINFSSSDYFLDHWETSDGISIAKPSSDSTNATVRSSGTITAIFSGWPDIIISDISLTPANPREGDNITFNVEIKNKGTGDAGNFNVTYYINATQLGQWSVTSLQSDQTTSKTFMWKALKGNHTVDAFADSRLNISENNETNNRLPTSFTVLGKPNLVVADIRLTPPSPREGDNVTFTVDIKNNGTADAGSFNVTYYINNTKLGEWPLPSLAIGQITNRTLTWIAVYGNHTVKINVDSIYNAHREKAFNVAGIPDLVISNITWTPIFPVENGTVTFTVGVKNSGNANARSFKTTCYVNQTKLGEWLINSLSVGQEVNKSFTWTYVDGSHVVRAIADCNGEIKEKDETNNEKEEIIGNRAPVASYSCNGFDCTCDAIAFIHKSTFFNATASYDPDGKIVSFCWDFGDGTIMTVTDPITTHNYTRNGNYTVTLNVTDNRGMWRTVAGRVTVELKCDLNRDGVVDVVDVTIVSVAYDSRLGDPNWNPEVDFDKDGSITIIDITVLAVEYGAKE